MKTYINGRFLNQKLSGVQRFAREIVQALDGVLGPEDGEWEILMPPGTACDLALTRITAREVGRNQGVKWQQLDLWRAASGDRLVNLCNTGPVLHSRSFTVLHDVMVFRTPGNYSFAYRSYHQLLDRLIARRSRLGTVSDFSRREIGAVLGPKDAVVLHNSSEHIGRITPDAGVLERLGLAPQGFAMMLGSVTPNKNAALAIEAMRRLGAEAPRLVIVGALNPKVFGNVLSDSQDVIFAGRLSDEEVVALYAAAAALIFPSRYEGFGIPPLEAMCFGCPVLSSNIPPVQEVCGEAALYFSPDAPDELAGQWRRLVSEPGLRARMIALGHERRAQFSWAESARRLAAAVREL